MALNEKQYQVLALKLRGTGHNVYELAERLFDTLFTDGDFDALKKATGVFRCEECGVWKGKDEEEPEQHDYCSECVTEMNAEDDEAEADA